VDDRRQLAQQALEDAKQGIVLIKGPRLRALGQALLDVLEEVERERDRTRDQRTKKQHWYEELQVSLSRVEELEGALREKDEEKDEEIERLQQGVPNPDCYKGYWDCNCAAISPAHTGEARKEGGVG
jgi:hypothetical protein